MCFLPISHRLLTIDLLQLTTGDSSHESYPHSFAFSVFSWRSWRFVFSLCALCVSVVKCLCIRIAFSQRHVPVFPPCNGAIGGRQQSPNQSRRQRQSPVFPPTIVTSAAPVSPVPTRKCSGNDAIGCTLNMEVTNNLWMSYVQTSRSLLKQKGWHH